MAGYTDLGKNIEARHRAAIKACMQGQASPEQAQMAMEVIMVHLCGFYVASFSPDSDRQTTFNEGRKSVAYQMAKIAKEPVNPTEGSVQNSGGNTNGRRGRSR